MTSTERRDLYCEYRLRGEDSECSALRVGVSRRTAQRYEAQLRKITNQQREGATGA